MTVAPTPAMTPLITRSESSPGGSTPATSDERLLKTVSIRSIGSLAMEKMLTNNTAITAAKIMMPAMGWVRIRSSLSVAVSASGSDGALALFPRVPGGSARATHCTKVWSAHLRRPGSSPGGVNVGTTPVVTVSAMTPRSWGTPSLLFAEMHTTGQPTARDNAAASTDVPVFRARSIMLTATTVGRRRRSASPSKGKLRARLVASITMQIASGSASASPVGVRRPASTSRQIADSICSSSSE